MIYTPTAISLTVTDIGLASATRRQMHRNGKTEKVNLKLIRKLQCK